MATASEKALIREMDPVELQGKADEIYSRHNGNLHALSDQEHDTLKQCASNYYHLTGEALIPSFNPHHQQL